MDMAHRHIVQQKLSFLICCGAHASLRNADHRPGNGGVTVIQHHTAKAGLFGIARGESGSDKRRWQAGLPGEGRIDHIIVDAGFLPQREYGPGDAIRPGDFS